MPPTLIISGLLCYSPAAFPLAED